MTDLRCHHPERDYGNLSHLPELTVSRPQCKEVVFIGVFLRFLPLELNKDVDN